MLRIDATILIVDDDESLRKSLARLFRSMGFTAITVVSDGSAAAERLMSEQFECVISDLEMPIVSGLDLLRVVRGDGRTKNVPFVLMSGRMDDSLESTALALGASACLAKSNLTVEALTELLQRIGLAP
jgi:CheY-like chemotaxis protein